MIKVTNTLRFYLPEDKNLPKYHLCFYGYLNLGKSRVDSYTSQSFNTQTCRMRTQCWWPAAGRAETELGRPAGGTAAAGWGAWSSARPLRRTPQWCSTPRSRPGNRDRTDRWPCRWRTHHSITLERLRHSWSSFQRFCFWSLMNCLFLYYNLPFDNIKT